MLALPHTARKCERYQLCMRAISRSSHTKLKNMKIYSKGVLVNHTKITTNENFPLAIRYARPGYTVHILPSLSGYALELRVVYERVYPGQP